MKPETIYTLKVLGVAALVAAACPDLALAQNMQQTTSSLAASMRDMPTVLSGLAYLGGGVMVLGGANKLKQHAENPQQTPMSHGLVRMGVGGMVAGLPAFMGYINNTMSVGNSTAGFKKMQPISELLNSSNLFG